jgi:adenosylcobinamide-phosphate synthase
MLDVIALALGFLFDQFLGDSPHWPHPVRWIGRLISFLEQPLRRFGGERIGSVILLGAVTAAVGCGTWAVLALAGRWHPWAQVAVASVLIYYGLAARSLARETEAVLKPSEKGDLAEARQRLSDIVGRDTGALGSEEINRACVETVAENTTDGVVAPLFYAALAGPVGLWVYKAINTLDSMVGYHDERYAEFGWASARLDDLVNFIPARLTAVLIWMCALILGYDSGRSRRITLRDASSQPSPNAGYPEAAVAGALGIRLGGVNFYSGARVDKPYLGDAVNPLDKRAFLATRILLYASSALMLLVMFGVALA